MFVLARGTLEKVAGPTSIIMEYDMRVVQVTALRDYEGVVWSALFSSVEAAFADLKATDADDFAGVDDVVVAWVGVDDGSYERVDSLGVEFTWGAEGADDTVRFTRWDSAAKKSVEVAI